LLKNVNKAIREFEMIADGDRVAVAVSGGKDSRSLLHLLRARQRTVPEKYHLTALHVEADIPGYPDLRSTLEPWFRELEVDFAFVPLELPPDEPLPLDCFRCSWNRRKETVTSWPLGTTPTMRFKPHCSIYSILDGWRRWLPLSSSSTIKSLLSVLSSTWRSAD
jgi:hypothetical protein